MVWLSVRAWNSTVEEFDARIPRSNFFCGVAKIRKFDTPALDVGRL